MKPLAPLFWIPFLALFNGCTDISSLMMPKIDKHLSNIDIIHTLPTKNAIGFEWSKIEDYDVDGVNVYKKVEGTKEYHRIHTIRNPYATHFVDVGLQPSTIYTYKFTTFSLGKESIGSKAFSIKTLKTFEPIAFVKAYAVASKSIKLLWQPHPHPSIKGYIVERSLDGKNWNYLARVEGQLMVEYIDTFVRSRVLYFYRIIALSYDDLKSQPSAITQIAI